MSRRCRRPANGTLIATTPGMEIVDHLPGLLRHLSNQQLLEMTDHYRESAQAPAKPAWEKETTKERIATCVAEFKKRKMRDPSANRAA